MELNTQTHQQTEHVKSIEDKENDLRHWIHKISDSNPDLKGFSICPFAKNNTYKIVHCSIHDIHPLKEEYGVVIFVVEDELDLNLARNKIEELNQKYTDLMFFDDFRDEPSYIGNLQTNNRLYNLILYQNSEFLSQMREKLARTTYYDHWDENYLRKILKNDYEMIQQIRNK